MTSFEKPDESNEQLNRRLKSAVLIGAGVITLAAIISALKGPIIQAKSQGQESYQQLDTTYKNMANTAIQLVLNSDASFIDPDQKNSLALSFKSSNVVSLFLVQFSKPLLGANMLETNVSAVEIDEDQSKLKSSLRISSLNNQLELVSSQTTNHAGLKTTVGQILKITPTAVLATNLANQPLNLSSNNILTTFQSDINYLDDIEQRIMAIIAGPGPASTSLN